VTINVIPNSTGELINQASVDSDQADPRPQNDSDTEGTFVQPHLFGGYVRPKTANRLRLSLVPAYQTCTSPNRIHGPPLTHPSCNPPARESTALTVGTPDSNGEPAKSEGSLVYSVLPGLTATSADEADVLVELEITDVRRAGDLTDYTGGVEANATIRVTDKNNFSSPSGPAAGGTVVDFPFPVAGGCAATADPAIGATCAMSSSFDAVVPGAIKEHQRAVWAFGQAVVIDGGADGNVNTLPNRVFARQGVFVP
jgi:hypothetical protein